MKTQANETQHQRLLIVGVALILFGTSGIAAVMAWMPTPTYLRGVIFAHDKLSTPSAKALVGQAQTPSAQPEGEARIKVKCAECGVVVSTREITQVGTVVDPGAAGGVTRVGQIEIAGNPTKSYEVTVHMKDGSSRVFMEDNLANWRSGQRVILIEGASQSNE